MRKTVLVVIIALGLAAIFLVVTKRQGHRKELTAYFSDVNGLRVRAPVRLAGVDVGSVIGVRARPDLHDNPAEVRMGLRTDYELNIPKDSVVSIAKDGLLGEAYVNVDVREAVGSPVEDYGILKSRVSSDLIPPQFVEHLAESLNRKISVAPAQGNGQGDQTSPGSTPIVKH